jgi:hypothetical protein
MTQMDKFFNHLSEAATHGTVGFIFSVNVRKRLEKVNKNDKMYTRGPPPIFCVEDWWEKLFENSIVD